MATVIAELLVEIGVEVKDAKKAETALAKVTSEADGLGDASGKSTGKLAGMAGALKTMAKGAAIAAAAVAAIGIAVFKFVNSQTEAIDATNKLSTALGLGVEELQRLQFAASQSGLSADGLKSGILKLNEATLKLKESAGGPAVEALDDLGLSLKDLDGLSQTSQIGLIGDRLQEIEDAAERSALAARIFGKTAGPDMATLLQEGQEGLNKLADSAENVLTQEQADRASEFQDRIGELTQFVEGLAQIIAIELAPPILEIIESIQNWVAANREIIDSGINIFVGTLTAIWNALVDEVKIVIAIFGPLVSWIIRIVKRVNDATGAFKVFKSIVVGILTPFRTLIKLAVKVAEAMEKVGLLSEGSAAKFESSINRMVEASSGLDTIAAKADRAGEALADLSEETEDAVDESGQGISIGAPTTPEQQERNIRRERRRQKRGARAAEKPGGGGVTRTTPKTTPKEDRPKEDKPELPGVTLPGIESLLFSGDPRALTERIRGLQLATPSTKDIKPRVAIDFFEFNITNNIKSTDPKDAASEVAQAIKRAFTNRFAQAAETVDTPVKG